MLGYSLFRAVKLTKYIDPDNIDALDIVLDLIQEAVTCYLMVAGLVKMNQCSVLIWVHLYMLIIRKKYIILKSYFWSVFGHFSRSVSQLC